MDTVKFSNAIQLEEITHFQRDKPTRSILSTHKKFKKKGPKKVSYEKPSFLSSSYEKYSSHDDEQEEDIIDTATKNNKVPTAIPGSSNSNISNSYNKDESRLSSEEVHKKHQEFIEDSSSETFNSDDDDDDDTDQEFHRDFTTRSSSGFRNTFKGNGSAGGSALAISDENLFPIPSIQVTKSDFIFSLIALLINFGELITDFILVGWHYQNEQKWASGLTMTFVTTGGIGLLYQFGLLQQTHLDRLFRRGKRVRILVSCFPPAATLIVSYHSTMTAWKAITDPMLSQQYFKISEFLQSLSRIQSFFQAAPQATLQLVILLENFHETSWEKALFTIVSILISLTVMTNANLPSKTDVQTDDCSPNKAAYIPLSRIFMGLRMFSSLGSRIMALTYLLIGCRCLLQPDSSYFSSTLVGLGLTIFPRLVFALTDYFTGKVVTRRNLERYREQPELGVSSSHPIEKLPFIRLFMGYLATIFFPVGDPLWLFWYLWCESGIFIIFGNVAGTVGENCLDPEVDGIFTGVFVIVFIIVPIVIPYLRAVVQRYKVQRFMRVLQVVEDRDDNNDGFRVSGGTMEQSNTAATEIYDEEAVGINDNPNYDPSNNNDNSSSDIVSTNYSGNPFNSQTGLAIA